MNSYIKISVDEAKAIIDLIQMATFNLQLTKDNEHVISNFINQKKMLLENLSKGVFSAINSEENKDEAPKDIKKKTK